MGTKWGQILFFARSSPFSQWRDLFAVINNGKVKFLKKKDFSPHLAPLKVPNGAKWGQILFFAQSSPFSQWRNLFASYEQWQSQTFKKLDFSPHLVHLMGPNEAKSEFCPIFTIFKVQGLCYKLWTKTKSQFCKIYLKSAQLPRYVLGIGLFCY